MYPKEIIVIGAGFAGISAATALAAQGHNVTVLEKHAIPGGRARVMRKDGFTFDMGPSWYWMPEVMSDFFNRFGCDINAYMDLKRLDPSYQIIYGKTETWEVAADFETLKVQFEEKEAGAGFRLDQFLKEAQLKYEKGMRQFANKPALSIWEFAKKDMLRAALKLDLFKSFAAHVRKFFNHPHLIQMLEFPVLFLGAMPKDIPALYSMMNYADIKLGTWYPMGGFGKLVEAMVAVSEKKGVRYIYNADVQSFSMNNSDIRGVQTQDKLYKADMVVSTADYHFTEQLLPLQYQNYNAQYWERRVMSPSCLLYYIGINKKIPKLKHHNLFFENAFDAHAAAIYVDKKYPDNPLYYVCCPSKTDSTVAPEGMENLFLLIPVAAGLEDSAAIRKKYFDEIIQRLEVYCETDLKDNIVSYTDYALDDFSKDYNAFKGNAYGLANTLRQTAVLKPRIKNKYIDNLYYAGQLTVPGPGVPPSIMSGQIVADYIASHHP